MIKKLYLRIFWPSRRFFQGLIRSLSWLIPTPSRFEARAMQRLNLKMLRDAFVKIRLERVGAEHDGGYLIPEFATAEIDALFSPGVATVATFERHFAEQGVHCYLIDGSVDAAPESHPNITFEKAWLSAKRIDSQKSLTLEEWILNSDYPQSSSLGLQMDIEGHEWGVLQNADQAILMKFKFVTVEFHWMQASSNLSEARTVNECVSKLLRFHSPVWIHPNNGDFAIPLLSKVRYPPLLEVSFVRNDFLRVLSKLSAEKGELFEPESVDNDQRFASLRGVAWLQKKPNS